MAAISNHISHHPLAGLCDAVLAFSLLLAARFVA
jgi:hypothetical protein